MAPSLYRYWAGDFSMRTILYLSPLRKLCSKMAPSRMLRSLALMTAPARAILMCCTFTTVSSLPSISKAVPGRKSLVSINQVFQCQKVTGRAKPGDHAHRRRRGHRPGAEAAVGARVQVRDVHLDDRRRQRLEAIVERDRVVGQGAPVEDDPVRLGALPVQVIDDSPLGRRLEEIDLGTALLRTLADAALDVGQGLGPVDLGLADAEPVQVGAVHDQDPHRPTISRTASSTTSGGTGRPTSARPSSRGRTHSTLPRVAFLSRGMAASTSSALIRGSRPGSP